MDYKKFFAHVTNPFGAKGPFYGAAGHHGADFAVGAHQPVPTYIAGTCVKNGHTSVLGNYTVLKVAGGYVGFAHCLVGTRPDVGQKLKAGDVVYKAAGSGDDHGSAWAGAHCHTTWSDSDIEGIWDGNVEDPWPHIKKAITPAPAPRPNTGKKYTTARSGEGFIKIAARTHASVATLERLNPRLDGGNLKLGQRVYYA